MARLFALAGDVADPVAVKALVQEVEAKLGAIDLLVNNAGTGAPLALFWETDPEAWWRCQEVNLRGPMLCCRAVLPGMIRRRAGRIVNVASGRRLPGLSQYVGNRSQQDSVDSLQRATRAGTRRARHQRLPHTARRGAHRNGRRGAPHR